MIYTFSALHYLGDLRLRLEALAKPPPPPIIARKPPPVPTQSALPRCKAIWSYSGVEEDELTFQESDEIEIVNEDDDAWWRGIVVKPDGSRSQSGLFPSNYVKKVDPNQSNTPSSPLPPARNLPPVYTPSVHSSDHAPSTYSFHSPDHNKNMQGYQGQSQVPMSMPSPYDSSSEKPHNSGVAPWQPGHRTHWSSGAPIPAPPPPPPQQYQQGYSGMPPSPAPSNQSYYQQQQQQQTLPEKTEMQQASQGPSNPALYGTQQPVPPDHNKNDKVSIFLRVCSMMLC